MAPPGTDGAVGAKALILGGRCDNRHIMCRFVLLSEFEREGQMTTGVAVWKFMFCRYSLSSSTLRNSKAIPIIATIMLCAVSATGAEMDRGEFKNVQNPSL